MSILETITSFARELEDFFAPSSRPLTQDQAEALAVALWCKGYTAMNRTPVRVLTRETARVLMAARRTEA